VIPIYLPPLRDRPEDIPLLVKYFINNFNREFKKNTKGVSRTAMKALAEYQWPGNIRELKNLVERVMILGNQEIIDLESLPSEIVSREELIPLEQTFVLPREGVILEELERSLIQQALKRTGGNQTRSASLLGLTRDTLRYRLKKYKL